MIGRPLLEDEYWDSLIAKNTAKGNEFRHRNQLLLGFSCKLGLRECELSQLTIDLFLTPKGELKQFIILPAEISYDGFDRPIVFGEDSELVCWIESYFDWLIHTGASAHRHKSYLGLDSHAPLFLDDGYKPFTLQKRGNNTLYPFKMNGLLDRLIMNAGLWDLGIRRKSFIRTFTIQAFRNEMTIKDLTTVTGQSQSTIEKTLSMDYARYNPVTDWFSERIKSKERRAKSFQIRRQFMI